MINNPEKIKAFVNKTYHYLGSNKQQEITRLLFEIAKREHVHFEKIAGELPQPPNRFVTIKNYLLERRYPSLTKTGSAIRPSFFDITIDPYLKVDISENPQNKQKQFFIEESVLHSELVKRVKIRFPKSSFEVIKSYRDHTRTRRFGIADYNHRAGNIYLIREDYDFYKRCPCSNNSSPCGYYVVNLGSGCPYECTYCVLQDYINSPGIVLPTNINDFFTAFRKFDKDIRCGSGELTDSLAFDHITGYSPQIVEFFRHHPKSMFEFKTKSNTIDLLTSVPGAKNIIVSWSLNPQTIIDTVEYFTASLIERLEAAQRCVACGYRVAFHFDPIIYYKGWENDYENLIDALFDMVHAEDIIWISLGTLRMTPQLKKIIENRFPDNTILDEEFLVGHDGKLRYPREMRVSMYTLMKSWIRKRRKGVPIYLCMEEPSLHSR
ncbi:MAG: hypothetical protein MRJ65_05775 [Candidatus Brocadiaceae bacterium]|nr:hypothetical protein [Candidatus Brocadiaceae bacterium]